MLGNLTYMRKAPMNTLLGQILRYCMDTIACISEFEIVFIDKHAVTYCNRSCDTTRRHKLRCAPIIHIVNRIS